jgi:hypothetical protein
MPKIEDIQQLIDDEFVDGTEVYRKSLSPWQARKPPASAVGMNCPFG